MKILVCVKQIPDPEAPLGSIKIGSDGRTIDASSLRQVVNPYDENALEAALRIKDRNGGEVTVLSAGHNLDVSVLRKALAVGADKLILLKAPLLENIDTNSAAYALSAAVKKTGPYDLVLTGRQAGDWDSGHTGIVLGQMLGIAAINLARKVSVDDGNVIVEKIVPGGYEEVRAALPALVTVSNEVGGLRYPSMKMILQSRRRPVDTWGLEDVQADPERIRAMQIVRMFPPPDLTRQCEFIDGGSPEEKGRNLAKILKREFG
ncbi:MAG: electron transfer flavoprotein subunit beta/FixA family protein [Pseudomonadota bacterium]